MPVPIPGPEVGSDSLKVKFLMIFGRPKTGFFDQISGPPGTFPQFPLATNHAEIKFDSINYCVVGSHRGSGEAVYLESPGISPRGNRLPSGNLRDFILRT